MSSQKIKKLKQQFQPFETSLPLGTLIPHLRICKDMTMFPAWKSLSLPAKWLYICFKLKFNGGNTENISMTFKEIENEMHIRTFIKSRRELLDRGFIQVVENHRYTRQCNIYGFSEDWKAWKPGK